MDPILFPIVNALAPMLAIATMGATIVGFLWVRRHYTLREKEIELEAQLHGKQVEAQLRAMEVRLSAIENSIIGRPSLQSPTSERAALLEAPPREPVKVR